MDTGQIVGLVIVALLAIFIITAIARAVRIVPQAVALIVERLGRYHSTMYAGLHFLIPFVDRVRAGVDLREQVVSFPPQPVITSDNLVVSIDTVIYFQVTDPKAATYEIANYITGIEQLTVTTLRNVIGSMDLEQTLTSRDQINGQLRGVLDEATGRWGIRVNRVELKAIDPPASVQGSMEQQMRAERDRRAAILTAEGVKQSQILTAEGEKQSAILRAEGQAQAAILKAEGDSRAILQVFDAIHRGDADPKLLAYQYLQTLPQIANGSSSKMWIVPTEFTAALNGIAGAFGGTVPAPSSDGAEPGESATARSRREPLEFEDSFAETTLEDPSEALRKARGEASEATSEARAAGTLTGHPFDHGEEAGQRPAQAHEAQTGAGGPAAPAGPAVPPSPDAAERPGQGEGQGLPPTGGPSLPPPPRP
ncbi:SPFH domain-containing protein [Miniimonas sp. S16]|uniref:SPFH domain-containing protein n=1 Tax=Miniimonas sp. S16 TaxID=2171623 RepID=UPI000D5274C7|nr:SPFH domain-containing protein [Miniimonas sp. S16]